jgi:hypothetical protein
MNQHTSPRLPDARFEQRRRHLMDEITSTPQPIRAASRWKATWCSRRRAVLTAIITTGVVAGVGAPAGVAGNPTVWFVDGDDQVVGTDVVQLEMVYDDRVIAPAQLEDLNEDGLAMVGVHNRELSCQGVALYFDTSAEADDYGEQFQARQRTRIASGDTAVDDPCATYRDAPDFTPDQP